MWRHAAPFWLLDSGSCLLPLKSVFHLCLLPIIGSVAEKKPMTNNYEFDISHAPPRPPTSIAEDIKENEILHSDEKRRAAQTNLRPAPRIERKTDCLATGYTR